MTPTRLKVLKFFLSKKNTVSAREMLNYFFAPSYQTIAKQFIERIEKEGEYKKIYFKGFSDPLFYPSDLNEDSLHQVIVESFNKKNWHYYEVPETRVMPNDVVIDCGAAEGLFGFIVQRRCKKIYLIEPLSKFVQALEKTFEDRSNVEIVPIAISDSEFSASLNPNDISSSLSDTGKGETVKVTTLDKIFFEKNIPVSYLKMDLEGYDFKALKGAENLIRKNKPKIAITTYHKKEDAEQMSQFLTSVVSEYKIRCKGIYQYTGSPVMLHAWI